MNVCLDSIPLVDELAAHWTEPALQVLHAVGARPVSVETELETWRALKASLRSELREPSAAEDWSAVMERVLLQATRSVLRGRKPRLAPTIAEEESLMVQ